MNIFFPIFLFLLVFSSFTLKAEENKTVTIEPMFSNKDSRITRSDLDPTFIMDDNARQREVQEEIRKERKQKKLEAKVKKNSKEAKVTEK